MVAFVSGYIPKSKMRRINYFQIIGKLAGNKTKFTYRITLIIVTKVLGVIRSPKVHRHVQKKHIFFDQMYWYLLVLPKYRTKKDQQAVHLRMSVMFICLFCFFSKTYYLTCLLKACNLNKTPQAYNTLFLATCIKYYKQVQVTKHYAIITNGITNQCKLQNMQ